MMQTAEAIAFVSESSKLWIILFVVIVVSAILPSLKDKTTISKARKQDVFFQITGLILLILILIFSFGALDYPIGSMQSPMNIVAIAMFIIGLIISVHAQVTINTNYYVLGACQRARVRHPIYLGTFIRIIAIPIYASSLPGFLLAWLSVPVLNYRIGIEEKMLIEEFGEDYIRYKERTWKLFPFIY